MVDLVSIETGTDIGTVLVNPAHVAWVHKNMSTDASEEEWAEIRMVSGESFTVDATIQTVAALLKGA